MAVKKDVYQVVTDRIVAMLENADHGKWVMPWHRTTENRVGAFAIPTNTQGREYRGINVWLLLATKLDKSYASDVWGTYNAWSAAKAQVRKGEKATEIVFWQSVKVTETDPETGKMKIKMIPVARFYNVFNADQVENYTAKPKPQLPVADRIANADIFFAALPARVLHGGNRAYYSPSTDHIQLPTFEQFHSSEAYYATRGHETVHWTGDKSRCDREFGKRFGDEAYAFEELVAELGAAFLCAHLDIENEPRADHAAYLATWLKRCKEDKRAIFTAASKAQKAVDFILAAAGEDATETEEMGMAA